MSNNRRKEKAATRIQREARRTRITKSLFGQLDEFLSHLSQSPNVLLLEILEVSPANPPNTLTLMVDTRTQGGATKRMLLCIDVDADRKILDINADCIKDRMPPGGFAGTIRYGSLYTRMGPSQYGEPSLLGSVPPSQLNAMQEQLRRDLAAKRDGMKDRYTYQGRTRYPTVSQLGLEPQQLLDILEPNYCVYPIFKKICKELRQKNNHRQI